MATPLDRHPFISFGFTTRSLPPEIWMSLGEAMSKCQHLAGVPLKPAAALNLASVYLARGVQATTAIEGNTLSDAEVKAIVAVGSAKVPESRAYLEREVQNVLRAVREIDDSLRDGARLPITADRLKYLNHVVLDGIPDKPEVQPGEFRQHSVAVGPYLAPPWESVVDLVERFVQWLNELRSTVTKDSRPEDRFVNAVLAAVLAHLYIAWIHPFGNGNGRVARLIEVQILSESGVVPIVATNLLSDHYNKTRSAYYLALDEAQRDVNRFVGYAVRGFVDELRAQIETVRQENLAIHWESYVHEIFRSKPSTEARDRQRELALSLKQDITVHPEEVADINTSLARRYAVCGPRTPARDLNDLVKMGLARRAGSRSYVANRELIEAFIPPTA
jgi:Fic family protein